MSWNWRIVRTQHKDGAVTFGLHEAYYDARGKVWAITDEPVAAEGDSPEEVQDVLRRMLEDAERAPLLYKERIPEPGAKHPLDKDDDEETPDA